MTDREQTQPEPDESREAADDQGGVFGNLPEHAARECAARGAGRASLGAPASAPRSPSAPRAQAAAHRPSAQPARRLRRHRPSRNPRRPTGDARRGGVEDLAWAGIAVAAEAATLGVRLLSRAVEAVRKPADRR